MIPAHLICVPWPKRTGFPKKSLVHVSEEGKKTGDLHSDNLNMSQPLITLGS